MGGMGGLGGARSRALGGEMDRWVGGGRWEREDVGGLGAWARGGAGASQLGSVRGLSGGGALWMVRDCTSLRSWGFFGVWSISAGLLARGLG